MAWQPSVLLNSFLFGGFSVSSSKKVNFSQGNLYYDGSEFKFETNQYDYPGSLEFSAYFSFLVDS